MDRTLNACLLALAMAASMGFAGAAQAATFVLSDKTGLDGVSVRMTDDVTGAVSDVTFNEAAKTAIVSVTHGWLTRVTFSISLPAREPEGELTRKLSPSEVSVTFAVRAVFDPQTISIPIRAIEAVTGEYIDGLIDNYGLSDAVEQQILLQQEFAAWKDISPQHGNTRKVVKKWADVLFNASTERIARDVITPLFANRALTSALTTAFNDRRFDLDEIFFPRIDEVKVRFWNIPKQLPQILALSNCAVTIDAAKYVLDSHRQFPDAAIAARIPDPPEQIAAMSAFIDENCPDDPNPLQAGLASSGL